MYFDMAFNMGITQTIKIAQKKILGLKDDGIVGPLTRLHY